MSVPLTDVQAQALLTDKRNKAKPVAKKILSYLNASTAFMLADGAVIYYQQGYHQLAFKDFFALVTNRESVFTTKHDAEYFLVNHARHLRDFSRYFSGIQDFSLVSLDKVDGVYSQLVKSGVSEADLFLPLVCYAAELFIRQTTGRWGKNPSEQSAAAIIGQDGKVYDPYFCLRKILVNSHKPFAIQAALAYQLTQR